MPNHCSNDLFIKGKSGVKEFMKFIRVTGKGKDHNTAFECNNIIPYPENFRKLDEAARAYDEEERKAYEGLSGEALIAARKARWEKNPRPKDGFNSGGYEWCIANWGTKWGVYDVSFEQKEGKEDTAVKYTFDSAWSPPLPVILACSKRFPELTFTLKYYEQGAGYKGVYKCKGGEVIEETEGSYSGSRGG